MRFDVLTIFPETFRSPLEVSLLGKAIKEGKVEVQVHDLRKWADPPHFKVDDQPFGGGAGMVMTPGPIVAAAENVLQPGGHVLLMSASGRPLDQQRISEFRERAQLVLVCGRYEGMDDRIREVLKAEEVSIGNFVLSGGELAALAVIDAVTRTIPGVMGNQLSLEEESFSQGLLEYPQYTRPYDFRGHEVPDVLRSGDHGQIAQWRRSQALRKTFENRPDLLEKADLEPDEREKVRRWMDEI